MNVALADPTMPHTVRLTVRDFLLLNEHGAFDAYAKSELIDGEILCVNSQFNGHAMAQTDLLFALASALKQMASPLRATVEVGVELDEHNVPEPDIVVTAYRGEGNVPGRQVSLVVEVADTTLNHDLTRKATLYARSGLPEYWVLDVENRKLHQFSSPNGDSYDKRRESALGGRIEAVTIAGLSVDTSGI